MPRAALRVVIVDDEPIARQRVRRIAAQEEGIEIVAECGTGREAQVAVIALAPDLLVLDVQMPGLDGFGVLAALPEDRVPLVIFVTAFDEHALRAFEVHALDYVLKPIDPDRLRSALARARRERGRAEAALQQARLRELLASFAGESLTGEVEPPGGLGSGDAVGTRRFLVKTNTKMFFVDTSDVDWIEADGNYVRLHVGTAAHTIRGTIGSVENALPTTLFARIHRSAIVNLDRIAEMRQSFSGDYIVFLKTGARLRLSRSYRHNIAGRWGRPGAM